MQVLQFYYSEIINNKHNINNIFKINIITKIVIENKPFTVVNKLLKF